MTYPVKASISQNFGENPTANIRPGNPDYWIIQQFGNYQPDGHTGIDFSCKAGTEVRAVADGTVLHIGWMGGTYASNPWWVAPDFAGYCAVIDHGSFIGIYGHCKDGSAKVGKGARVREGQVFILSGNTGGSTGDHLHFEVLPDGYNLNARFYGRVNPLPYLGSASVGPAGDITETTEPKEDTLSAAEVQQINDHTTLMLNQLALDGQLGGRTRGGMADVADKVGDVWSWLRGGESGKRVAGPIPAMLAAIQGQNAGLLEALKQVTLTPGSALDLEAVKEASKAGASEALADLEATATTTVTLSQEGN